LLVEIPLDKLLQLRELRDRYAGLQRQLASQYVNDPSAGSATEDVWSKQPELMQAEQEQATRGTSWPGLNKH
jgi:DICT domain-containing protein